MTCWIRDIKDGQRDAFEKLYERYFNSLVTLARRRLLGTRARRVTDEEDVAASAMHSFWKGVERGRFEHLKDRDNLWPLLVVIASRKAIDAIVKENRRRPSKGKVHGESLFGGDSNSCQGFDYLFRQNATEQTIVELNENFERLLEKLDDDTFRQVALLKLEGFNRQEIARKTDYSVSTIARMLQLIRQTWAEELDE